MFYNWKQRGYNFEEIFMTAQEKVEEKWNSLTLEICRKELEDNYKNRQLVKRKNNDRN